MTRQALLLLFSVVLLPAATSAQIPEKPAEPADKKPSAAEREDDELNDWIQTYYQHPQPAQLAEMVTRARTARHFDDPNTQGPTIGFFSQIIKAHPEQFEPLFARWSQPTKNEQGTVAMIAWASGTDEGTKFLKSTGREKWLEKPPLDYAEFVPTRAEELDWCWGAFFATGDGVMVQPIIRALDYNKYHGALDAFKAGDKSKEKQREAYLEAVFKAASWSLAANGRDHPKVEQALALALRDEKTPKERSLLIGIVLSQVAPDRYKVVVPEKQP